MTDETIGKAAGVIWQHLSDRRETAVTLRSLKKIPGIRADEAMAAVGWLAREGKLQFDDSKRTCMVILFELETCLN